MSPEPAGFRSEMFEAIRNPVVAPVRPALTPEAVAAQRAVLAERLRTAPNSAALMRALSDVVALNEANPPPVDPTVDVFDESGGPASW